MAMRKKTSVKKKATKPAVEEPAIEPVVAEPVAAPVVEEPKPEKKARVPSRPKGAPPAADVAVEWETTTHYIYKLKKEARLDENGQVAKPDKIIIAK